MEQQRDLTIDIAKGITIFLMVWGHSIFGTFAWEKIYLFHMPLFFFISGFFFKNMSFVSYLKNKSQRLLFPFIFYWIFIRIWNIFSNLIIQKANLKEILMYVKSEEFFPKTGPLWFLLCLFLLSIVSYFLILKIPKKYHLLILLVSITLAYLLPQQEGKFTFYYGQALLMLPFYMAGYYFYNNNSSLYKSMTYSYRSYYIAIISGILLFVIPWQKNGCQCTKLAQSNFSLPWSRFWYSICSKYIKNYKYKKRKNIRASFKLGKKINTYFRDTFSFNVFNMVYYHTNIYENCYNFRLYFSNWHTIKNKYLVCFCGLYPHYYN